MFYLLITSIDLFVCVCTVPWHMCKWQMAAFRSWVSLFSMWIRSSGSIAYTFILLSHFFLGPKGGVCLILDGVTQLLFVSITEWKHTVISMYNIVGKKEQYISIKCSSSKYSEDIRTNYISVIRRRT